MFHKIKGCISLFVVVAGLTGASVPTFANTVKTEKNRASENYTIDMRGKKSVALKGRYLSVNGVHSYRVSVKPGETIVLTLRSSNPTSLKIQSPSGAVNQGKNEKAHKAVLTGNGDFIVEIGSENLTFYTIEAATK